MNQEIAFDQVLGQLYEAAFDPNGMRMALASMVELLDGDTCHLVGWDRSAGTPTLSVSTGLPPEVGPDYAAHYAQIDPRRRLALTRAPGQLLMCHEHFSPAFVGRNEFYQDYLIPQVGIHYLLGAGDLIPESNQMIMIGFQRRVGHEPFGAEAARSLERLVPHLRRSLRLQIRVNELANARQFAQEAMEATHLAAFAISSTGRVVWANAKGEAILRAREWVELMHERFHACDPDSNGAMQQAIRNAINHGTVGNVNLAKPDKREHCCLTLMPMPKPTAATSQVLDHHGALLAIMATSGANRVPTVQQLIDFFALSAAEARLARALAQGEDLARYVQAAGLRLPTAKTQLRSVFAKTGTGTQRDLVRLVLSLPVVRR